MKDVGNRTITAQSSGPSSEPSEGSLGTLSPRKRFRNASAGPEGNARLTAATGVLLLVLLFLEGVTVLSIGPLLSWHVLIGLVLLPPVALKMASTLWRFAHYYLGSIRYQEAGPPVLLLRLIGPFVTLSTLAVLITGVVVWLLPPNAGGAWIFWHKATFVLWFGVMSLHVLGHIVRATRLAAADAIPALSAKGRVPHGRLRELLVFASLIGGIGLGFAAKGASSNWTSWLAWAGQHH